MPALYSQELKIVLDSNDGMHALLALITIYLSSGNSTIKRERERERERERQKGNRHKNKQTLNQREREREKERKSKAAEENDR